MDEENQKGKVRLGKVSTALCCCRKAVVFETRPRIDFGGARRREEQSSQSNRGAEQLGPTLTLRGLGV